MAIRKSNDESGIDKMNKMYSTMIIETKDNKKISRYMNKTLKDIKFQDDFKPIFEKKGINEYSKKELLEMKTSNKGPTFNGIEKIQIVNIPERKNIINGKIK